MASSFEGAGIEQQRPPMTKERLDGLYQAHLAQALFGGELGEKLGAWAPSERGMSEAERAQTPAARYRAYVNMHPEFDLTKTDDATLRKVLEEADIRLPDTLH